MSTVAGHFGLGCRWLEFFSFSIVPVIGTNQRNHTYMGHICNGGALSSIGRATGSAPPLRNSLHTIYLVSMFCIDISYQVHVLMYIFSAILYNSCSLVACHGSNHW